MALTYVHFDPDTHEPAEGTGIYLGASKDDLLLELEAEHYAETQKDGPNERKIRRLEKRHASVLAASTTAAARQALNDQVLAEQTADVRGQPDTV